MSQLQVCDQINDCPLAEDEHLVICSEYCCRTGRGGAGRGGAGRGEAGRGGAGRGGAERGGAGRGG